jgi:hypothetical protein
MLFRASLGPAKKLVVGEIDDHHRVHVGRVDGVDPDVAQSPPSGTLRQYSQDEQETPTNLHTAAAKAWFTSCQCPSKLHCS